MANFMLLGVSLFSIPDESDVDMFLVLSLHVMRNSTRAMGYGARVCFPGVETTMKPMDGP